MARRDFGAEAEATIRAAVRADPDARRAAALAAQPPVETKRPRMFDLVELDPRPRHQLDIRYAGRDNFIGTPFYTCPAPSCSGRRPRRWRARTRPGGEGLRPADPRRLSALARDQDVLGRHPPEQPELRRRPVEGLAAQPRARGRPDPLRPRRPASRSRWSAATTSSRPAPTPTSPGGTSLQRWLANSSAGRWRSRASPSIARNGGTSTTATGPGYPIGNVTFTS